MKKLFIIILGMTLLLFVSTRLEKDLINQKKEEEAQYLSFNVESLKDTVTKLHICSIADDLKDCPEQYLIKSIDSIDTIHSFFDLVLAGELYRGTVAGVGSSYKIVMFDSNDQISAVAYFDPGLVFYVNGRSYDFIKVDREAVLDLIS